MYAIRSYYVRYPPDYRGEEIKTRLDWSAWPGAGGGFQGAVEMCNNNGACRKLAGETRMQDFVVGFIDSYNFV